MQGGSGAGGNMILEWDTDVATTRKSVPKKQRKQGLIICYCQPELGWINEQFVYKGTSNIVSDNIWSTDNNWRKLFSEEQLGQLETGKNLVTYFIYGKYIGTNGNEVVDNNGICTPFISVKPNTIYSLSDFATSQDNCNQVSYYTTEEQFISGISKTNFHQFKTPSNCEKIRLTIKSGAYKKVFDEDIIMIESPYIPIAENYLEYKPATLENILNNFTNSKYLNYPYPNFETSIQQRLFFYNNGKEIRIFNYNTKYKVFSNLAYYTLGSDGKYIETEDISLSNFVGFDIDFYTISYSEVIGYIINLAIVPYDKDEFPVAPPISSIATIGSNYLTTKEIARYGYGNINTDTAMKALTESDFTKLSAYTKNSAYKFLQQEDGINKIVYQPGEAWENVIGGQPRRNLEIRLGKYLYSSSWKLDALSFFISFSFKFYIEKKSIYDFLIDGFYLVAKVISNNKTVFYSNSAGFSNSITNLDGEEVQQLEAGNRYILITKNSNYVYVYYYYVDVISENEFKVSAYGELNISNINVVADRIIGQAVEPEFYISVYTGITDFDYLLKIYEPKFNVLNFAMPENSVFNISGLLNKKNATNKINLLVDTDISTIEQLKVIPFTEIENSNLIIKNELKNAKVVWLGTSVPNEPPYGESHTQKYPEFVSQLLNLNLTVRSIGGTKMTYNPDNNVYGLSMTEAEYEEHKSAANIERSYETQLEGCWDSDLFVFDHLHNDNGLLAALKDNPDYWDSDLQTFKITEANKFDRSWAVGGFNFVIAEIFRYNPRAKIAIINDWRAEAFYNKLANRVVADLWGIPICELHLCNGNVQINTSKDTYLKRYNGGANIKLLAGSSVNPLYYYTKSAPDESASVVEEETEITFNNGTDSIHPGRYGRIMYAKAVSRWMLNNVFLDKDLSEFI